MRSRVGLALTMCAGLALAGVVSRAQQTPAPVRLPSTPLGPGKPDTTSASPARALVSKYCVTCHNERLKTANVLLDNADADQVANSADTWERVVVQLRGRSMPPANMPRPDNATYE